MSLLSPERIEQIWDTHVGTPNEKYPFSTKDVIDFAQAIEHECAGEAWKEAAIAWQVCASIHRSYAKPGSRGKDALYTTRQADFNKHADDARAKYREATGEAK